MERDSTLHYRQGYMKRLENYQSRNVEQEESMRKYGLGNRVNEKVEDKPFTLEDSLQDAFNMIKENNEKLLEMRKE
jgi:hypothetical protein